MRALTLSSGVHYSGFLQSFASVSSLLWGSVTFNYQTNLEADEFNYDQPEEPIATRMLYSYFYGSRDPKSGSPRFGWGDFLASLRAIKTRNISILHAINLIFHDQRVNFGNADPSLLLVVDEMLLVDDKNKDSSDSVLAKMITALGHLLDSESHKVCFVTSALSSRISTKMVTPNSSRVLYPIRLSRIGNDVARTLIASKLKHAESSPFMTQLSVTCAIVECFGVPRLLSCLLSALKDYDCNAKLVLKTVRAEVHLAYKKDKLMPVEKLFEGLAASFCLPVHFSNLFSDLCWNPQSDDRHAMVFNLVESGLVFDLSLQTDRISYGIPQMLLTYYAKHRGKNDRILALAGNFGTADNTPGQYLPENLEKQISIAFGLLHWRDRLCAGVLDLTKPTAHKPLKCWILPDKRTTTSVAHLLNLWTIDQRFLPQEDHTIFTLLQLCDKEVNIRSLPDKYLTEDVNRRESILASEPTEHYFSWV